MYPSYPAADLVRTIQTTRARAVFVEDPKTLKALRGAPVEHWILFTGEAEGALTLEQLRAKGREVEYLRYEDEGHSLAKAKNRAHAYPRVLAFFQRHMGA